MESIKKTNCRKKERNLRNKEIEKCVYDGRGAAYIVIENRVRVMPLQAELVVQLS